MVSYEVKIERILGNKLDYKGDNTKAIIDVKTWLQCEWQCSMIEMEEYVLLCNKVDEIADRMIKAF